MITDLPVMIHGYTFVRFIGKGGFATVYLVQSDRSKMELCGKVMDVPPHATEDERQAVVTEINVLQSLNHPHIIRLYDHFVEQNRWYIILELCKGGTIASEMPNEKSLPLCRFRFFGKQIISALAHCHRQCIAHRDIKLGNILLDEHGRTKLADFGIALALRSQNEVTEHYAGSVHCESPELLNKRPHNPFKADVWALGVVFVEMITGGSPWPGETIGKVKKEITTGAYQLKKKIPDEVADVIARMLVVDPDSRITMEELSRLPLFADAPDDPDGFDCLSLIGRRHIVRVGLTIESGETAKKPEDGEEYSQESDKVESFTAAKSNALKIYDWNLRNGSTSLIKIKPRTRIVPD
jgi:serine/threonine protein kinase